MVFLSPFIKSPVVYYRYLTTKVSRSMCGGLSQQRRRYNDSSQRQFLSQMPGGKVDLHKDSQTNIATITLNYPEIKNGFSGVMMVGLRDAVDELSQWTEGKAVIVHGADGNFSSGGDNNLVRNIFSPEEGGMMSRYMQTTLNRLFQLPLVSVSAVDGICVGGAAELASACDFRIATPKARMGFVQIKMGVAPGWGGGARLVQLLGRTRSLQLLLSGKLLTAQEAFDIGFVQHVVDTEDLMNGTKDWLKPYIAADVHVVRTSKSVVVNGVGGLEDDVMAKERELFRGVWSGPAHSRAMNSNIKHK